MLEQPDPDIRVLIIDDHRMFGESLALLLSEEEGIDVLPLPRLPEDAN